MLPQDTDQKTSFVSFLALLLGFCGFATSLISIFLTWVLPTTKAKMPPMHKRSSRKRCRRRLVKTEHPNFKVWTPTLRRHSSFHSRPAPMTDPIPQRPNHTRHVSFNLDTSKVLRTCSIPRRRPCYPRTPIALDQFVESPSRRSSEDSVTLPSTYSSATSGSHSSPSMNAVELDIRPHQSYPSTPLPLLGKCLPGMKNAFTSRSKSFSISPSNTEPALRTGLLRSTVDSPSVPPVSLSEPYSRPGTAGSANSDTRSSFMRTFIPHRSKASSSLTEQKVDTSRKSSISFPNPWPISRSSTIASTPTFSADAIFSSNNPEQPTRVPFLRHFSLSKPPSPVVLESHSTSYFPIMRGKSQCTKARRTEPYGPPYNAPIPTASTDGSDIAIVLEKQSKMSRKLKAMQPGKPSFQRYSQDDLVHVLDKKLSAWQNTLTLETELAPKYIWEDPSPEVVFRDPDMPHSETTWDASANGHVVNGGWTTCYDMRDGPYF